MTDISNPRLAPMQLLELYIEQVGQGCISLTWRFHSWPTFQLFGHQGYKKIALTLKLGPYDWVEQTRDSYRLWLSYAVLKITPDAWGLRFEDGWLTEETPKYKEYLKNAPQRDVEDYYNWVRFIPVSLLVPSHLPAARTQVFPHNQAELWRQYYKDHYRKYFISSVHFWFFMHCCMNHPSRPLRPESTNNLFRHPLFFVANYGGPPPLVVPGYFLNNNANFDGLGDPSSALYYVFPNFAQVLFEYVAEHRIRTQSHIGSFADWYAGRQTAWVVPPGSTEAGWLINPHPVLKRHWRWEEVLRMLWSWRKRGGGEQFRHGWPFSCGQGQNGQVEDYLECFARMATIFRPVDEE